MLLEHGGSFRSFISQAGNDARKMVELIVAKIPSYRDESMYEVRVTDGVESDGAVFHVREIFLKKDLKFVEKHRSNWLCVVK